MKSIVIIFPYFGTLPSQYKMWRKSALSNPSVNFMFFTDANVDPAENIIVHRMKFDDFQKIVQKAFDFPIVLDRPYKLCEYKQAYGYILQDYIKNYDFWGFGDLDLVYGDIRNFIKDDVLAKYSFILGWGHLTLLKNCEDCNTYFMKEVPGYQSFKDAFSTSKITFFDEFNHKGCSDKWKDCRPQECWLEEPFDNVSKPKQAFHLCSLNRGWRNVVFEHLNQKLFMIRICHGKIEKMESLYAHFQHRPFMKDKTKNYNHFLVTPMTIINYPYYFEKIQLLYYCRKRPIRTKIAQWKDRLLWKLKKSYER